MRFFFNGSLEAKTLFLEDPEFHHLVHVLRAKVGDTIEVVNGKGELATASITAFEKNGAVLTLVHLHRETPKDSPIILAQATIRHLEWVVEKATELGVTEIWIFPGMKGEKKQCKVERLQAVAVSSLKQCGRLFLPKISLKPPLLEWQPLPGTLFFGDLSPTAPKLSYSTGPLTFAIGPESGFSAEEIAHLRSIGAQGVRLHTNTLRAETAGLTALSQLFILSP